MAALVGAACVSVLRLPLASVMIATLLSAKAGLAVAPLIVVAVAVAYLTSETLTAYVDARVGAAPSREQTGEQNRPPLTHFPTKAAAGPRPAVRGRCRALARPRSVRKRGIRRSTYGDHRYRPDDHVLPAFGEWAASHHREQIEGWARARSRTAEELLMVLRAIFRQAHRRDLVDRPRLGTHTTGLSRRTRLSWPKRLPDC